ncbi:MAG: hypothetical protein RIC56_11020 [Pseudomonadales bacterium]
MSANEQIVRASAFSMDAVNDVEYLAGLLSKRGESRADRYCASRHLIGSVCMACGRVYRLVGSMNNGGGLSHGWCDEACARVGARRAGARAREEKAPPH